MHLRNARHEEMSTKEKAGVFDIRTARNLSVTNMALGRLLEIGVSHCGNQLRLCLLYRHYPLLHCRVQKARR